mgnify:CR=1
GSSGLNPYAGIIRIRSRVLRCNLSRSPVYGESAPRQDAILNWFAHKYVDLASLETGTIIVHNGQPIP